jgi:SNF2 family DNA or RNA helicase
MTFNYTNSQESKNKILNLFIENSLNSYIEEINISISQKQKYQEKETKNNKKNNNNINSLDDYSSKDNINDNNFDINNPIELKINYPLKYFFKFLAINNHFIEIKKIYEDFFKENSLNLNLSLSKNNSLLRSYEINTNNNDHKNIADDNRNDVNFSENLLKSNDLLKKNIYYLFNISLIKLHTNFLDFSLFKNLLDEILFNESLLDLPNIEKYLSFIIINLSKVVEKNNNNNENENNINIIKDNINDENKKFNKENSYDNSLIIEKLFSYLNNNPNNNFNINNGINININNTDKTLELIFKILNIISDNKNFHLICINYIFDVIKYINLKNQKIRNLATNLFSKLMKIMSYIKLDRNYETQINQMKKHIKNFDNFNFIKNPSNMQLDICNENEKKGNNNNTKFVLRIKIKENLRHYQIAGIEWLSILTSLGLGLALCDDMGLGKTIQTLCCIANETKIYYEKYKKNPISLIICPNTLILNWIKESNKFFDEKEFILKKFEGKSFENLRAYNNLGLLDTSILMKKPKAKNNFSEEKENIINNSFPMQIYVTSYDKIREIENFEQEFFYVVLDEAHIIKNPKTKLYQNIKKINSERRIILTGTPIQNNVMELWSLFDYLMPGFLGSENDFEIKFHKKIYTNIKKLNLEEKLQENIFQNTLNDIRKRIKPFILRRLKHDVLKELPDKIIQDYICEMTDVQKELYNYWEKIYAKIGTNNNEEKTKKKINDNKPCSGNRISVLNVIDSMRKICNFPGMLLNKENSFDKNYCKIIKKNISKMKEFNSSGKLKALEDILISLNFYSNNNYENSNSEYYNSNNNIHHCGKIVENKILIFSQYRAMIKILKEFIESNFRYIKIKCLSSDMNENMRIEVVNSFNNDPEINILLLTTSIGGLGLSLTSANIVIMYDHDWNPMRDLQAMDRAHRLGQKKTVEVFR